MDPLFELAGLVLAHFDDEWIRHERPAPPIEPHADGAGWSPAERRQAIATCRALIDEVKGVEQVQMAPPARERAATARPAHPPCPAQHGEDEDPTEPARDLGPAPIDDPAPPAAPRCRARSGPTPPPCGCGRCRQAGH